MRRRPPSWGGRGPGTRAGSRAPRRPQDGRGKQGPPGSGTPARGGRGAARARARRDRDAPSPPPEATCVRRGPRERLVSPAGRARGGPSRGAPGSPGSPVSFARRKCGSGDARQSAPRPRRRSTPARSPQNYLSQPLVLGTGRFYLGFVSVENAAGGGRRSLWGLRGQAGGGDGAPGRGWGDMAFVESCRARCRRAVQKRPAPSGVDGAGQGL